MRNYTQYVTIFFLLAAVIMAIVGMSGFFRRRAEQRARQQILQCEPDSTTPTPSPTPAVVSTAATSKPWGWILLVLAIAGLVAFAWWVTKDSHPRMATTAPQAQTPSTPLYHKNVPHTEQEISVLGYSEERGTDKIDYSTIRAKKGGRAKYKFCIKEKISPGEIWMLNLAMFAENAKPGGNKEVVIIQINGTSQEIRLELGWVPDHEKNASGNITIKPDATIGGCENEFSISSLTGPIILRGPIKVIRRM